MTEDDWQWELSLTVPANPANNNMAKASVKVTGAICQILKRRFLDFTRYFHWRKNGL